MFWYDNEVMLSEVHLKDGILSKNDGLLAKGSKYAAFQYLVPSGSHPGIAPLSQYIKFS